MNFKFKSVLLIISLLFNGIFIFFIILASFSKTSNISFLSPDNEYITAAAVVSIPKTGSAVFELIEISLKPQEKAFLQFSVFSSLKQGNLLINALYDPQIISVIQTGYGIEITALSEGFTLMQTLANDGIKDVALILVKK